MNGLKIEAEGERTIRMTRSFNAPSQAVFDAWTKPEFLRRWLLGPGSHWSMPICDVDLRVGGTYRFVWRNGTDGSEMGLSGEYVEIFPPRRLVTTERFDDAWYPGGAVITAEFLEHEGVTMLTQRITYDSTAARDGVLRSPMESGVRVSYDRLEEMLMKKEF
jgi:uncharacterized protein YndB with AHSA1/START domain